jgi:Concanavalin A-like lectin/glucanases superfamily/Bacterial Ig-like domain (group 2)
VLPSTRATTDWRRQKRNFDPLPVLPVEITRGSQLLSFGVEIDVMAKIASDFTSAALVPRCCGSQDVRTLLGEHASRRITSVGAAFAPGVVHCTTKCAKSSIDELRVVVSMTKVASASNASALQRSLGVTHARVNCSQGRSSTHGANRWRASTQRRCVSVGLALLAAAALAGCGGGSDRPQPSAPIQPSSKTFRVTVALGAGVTGSPVAGTQTFASDAIVSYSFAASPDYENLKVLIDGIEAPASGTIAVSADKKVAAIADRRLVVATNVQAPVNSVVSALKAVSGPTPMVGYRATVLAESNLAKQVPRDSLTHYLRMARLLAYSDVDFNALGIAIKTINDSLAAASASPRIRAVKSSSTGGVTYIYVNGIHTTANEDSLTVNTFLPSVLADAGFADLSRYRTGYVYNPTGNSSDAKIIAAQACTQLNADALTEGRYSFASMVQCADLLLAAATSGSDIKEAAIQILVRPLKNRPVSGTAKELVDRIALELKSARVVIVAHSQGNLFVDEAYRSLEKLPGLKAKCVGTVSLAPPAPIQALIAGNSVNSSIVGGRRIKDILLIGADLLPEFFPGIGTFPANTNSLSDVFNANYDVLDNDLLETLTVGIFTIKKIQLSITGGIALHSINDDYFGFNRSTTIAGIQAQTQAVLESCVDRLEVSSPVDGIAATTLLPIDIRVIAPGGELGVEVTTPVTVALTTTSGGAALAGNTSVVPVNGVARFVNLRIDRAATNLFLTFSAGGVSASYGPFSVTSGPVAPVASVTLSPISSSIVQGGIVQLTATARGADGSALTGRLVTWSSNAPAVASVDATGLVTARSIGSASIIATSEAKSGSAAITVTPATIPAGLVASYPLDGNGNDESGNRNTGTLVGSPLPAVGRRGLANTALEFVTGSYVSAPSIDAVKNLTQELTLVFWVKRGTTPIAETMIPVSRRESGNRIHFLAYAQPGGFGFQCCSLGGSETGSFYRPTGSALSVINDGNWHQYALVRIFGAGGSSRLFLDGVELPGEYSSGSATAIPASISAALLIGRQASTSPGQFVGLLDDVMIFNKALTSTEIGALR